MKASPWHKPLEYLSESATYLKDRSPTDVPIATRTAMSVTGKLDGFDAILSLSNWSLTQVGTGK